MAGRILPTLPSWTAGQRVLASQLQQITTWGNFQANPPMFRMYQSIAQSIPQNVYTQITCDTSDYDSDSGRAGSTPWSYTVPLGMGGRWRLGGVVGFAANATATRFGVLYKNGSQITTTQIPLPGTSSSTEILLADQVLLAAGDVIALYCFQSTTGSVNTDAGHCLYWGQLISLGSP